jgi:phosphoglycolate phosphatase
MQTRAFDGIPELIHRLASDPGIVLGIVTGKSRRGVERLMGTNGFGNCFVVSRCADDCPSKPHPAMVLECCDQTGIAPINTLVVGDTSFDMEMAASAGAAAIGVSWGYHPVEKLIAPYVRTVVDTPADLEDGIEAWKQGFRAAGSSNRVAALADVARAHFLYA